MKNILSALGVLALGSFAFAASATASPASSLTGVSEQATPVAQQVTWYGHHGHRFYGRYYWGFYRPSHYDYGYGYGWKRYCYYHPYSWKCGHYGYGY